MKNSVALNRKFCVAPMMEWTDRHCRFFHRQLSSQAVLYTEMVTADAILFGDKDRLIGYSAQEHPVAIQLGGSDPKALADAAIICQEFGYKEVNINVGCPSDRVQSGRFGACLMQEPELVASCVKAMKDAADIPITVKCRIGVDDQEPQEALFEMAQSVFDQGCDSLIVHARKAWLKGLSPKENRDIPPLDYPLVYRLKEALPNQEIIINGGIETAKQGLDHLNYVDGVMLGRAAYHQPFQLIDVDKDYYGNAHDYDEKAMLEIMHGYINQHIKNGFKAHGVTRHMLGLYHAIAGAKKWRQLLTVKAVDPASTADILWEAYEHIVQGRERQKQSLEQRDELLK